MIHHDIEIDAFDALEDRLELRFDSFDYRDRVRTGLAINRDIDLALAVDANDVRLNLIRVFHIGDIANISGRAIANHEGEII